MWPHYMILKVSWDGLWTLSFGVPQFHGHGPWLVCEVALITGSHSRGIHVTGSFVVSIFLFLFLFSRRQACTDMVFGGRFEEGWQRFWLILWTQTPAIWAAVGTISKISFLYAEVDLIELKNLPLHLTCTVDIVFSVIWYIISLWQLF